MADDIQAGDRVQVLLKSSFWRSEGWFEGTVVRIDPYSKHRSFFWVRLDDQASAESGGQAQLISVINPKNIRKS